MTHTFKCPKCGYRNYITAEDLDAERIKAGERAKRWRDRANDGGKSDGPVLRAIRHLLKL